MKKKKMMMMKFNKWKIAHADNNASNDGQDESGERKRRGREGRGGREMISFCYDEQMIIIIRERSSKCKHEWKNKKRKREKKVSTRTATTIAILLLVVWILSWLRHYLTTWHLSTWLFYAATRIFITNALDNFQWWRCTLVAIKS